MRHVILTCKHHPKLRWSTKEIAVNEDGSYNGARHIFFQGEPTGKGMYQDGSGLHCSAYFKERDDPIVQECTCSPGDLMRAPEDALVKM